MAVVAIGKVSVAPSFAADVDWNRWAIGCQGCHRPDASGSTGGAPDMKDFVSRFVTVPGGREYLVRVPGVATAAFSDKDLAALLTFVLRRFDPQHLPADFEPYTAEEIAAGRKHPLRTEAAEVRQRLLSQMSATSH
ncbi:hypothetical protein JQ617_23960 [Bradyrhizobium sp. KB893862 SZCCT0404]|uniref:c-type cytochrome n=1 Tax=Bradyrhizobium sp. KB893862 SZCCT0404 TaxID=2807672 RepID=UPI001BA616DC|nr:hypothetical protein [Bradyrhizobium sp. KB893862 SZCCT0404]MBR1177028.1 hypothetical protein [Bradyrhizobium sp. KB893862 SZCCT0404]